MRAISAFWKTGRWVVLVSIPGLILTLGCADDEPGVGPGRVEVAVRTTGVPTSASSYTIRLGERISKQSNTNGKVFFEEVPAGQYMVSIADIHLMCNTAAESVEILVEPDRQTSVLFEIECTSKPLVFISDRKGTNELYRMNLNGSGVVRLATGAIGPRWSPDGSVISFLRGDELFIIGEDGKNERRVTTTTSDSPGAWSPDGQSLAFIRAGELFTVHTDGSQVRRLADLSGDVSGIDWGRQGAVMLIEYTPAGGETGIYTINPDGTGLTFITAGRQPAWSSDGSKIAFVRFQAETYYEAIYTMAFPDGIPVQRTETGAFETYPRWSPDDTMLTFTTYHGDFFGFNPEVYIGSPDSPDGEKLTIGLTNDFWSDWRPL